MHATRTTLRIVLGILACAASGPLCGCATLWGGQEEVESSEVYLRAGDTRVQYLQREVERLRGDLRAAEDAMISIESGLRGVHTRADAVSALAESRIALERARRAAPWRAEDCDEAQAKIDEAENQMRQGHVGTAIFFATRARRIAEGVLAEARRVEGSDGALFVLARRVNLRAGPTTQDRVLEVLTRSTPVFAEDRDGQWVLVRTHRGQVGWIYAPLLGTR